MEEKVKKESERESISFVYPFFPISRQRDPHQTTTQQRNRVKDGKVGNHQVEYKGIDFHSLFPCFS